MSRLSAALASAFLLAACSAPWAVQARAFTTGFKAGETIRYRIHTSVSGSLSLGSQQLPLTSEQTLTEKLQVQSVDSSGTATVTISVEDLVRQATGSATAIPPPVTLEIGPDGRIRSGAAAQLGGPVPTIPGSDQLTPLLSKNPVKPGDSWDLTYSRPNPYGSGGFQFTTRNRYLRNESISGRQAAVIQSTLTGPIDFTIDFAKLPLPPAPTNPPTSSPPGPVHYTGSVSSTTTYWLALDDGQVLKSHGSGSYALSYGMPAAGVAGPQQVAFNGTIKSDLTKL